MDIKTARSLEAKAVQQIAEKHGVIEARLAAIEATLADILAAVTSARPATTTTTGKKGG